MYMKCSRCVRRITRIASKRLAFIGLLCIRDDIKHVHWNIYCGIESFEWVEVQAEMSLKTINGHIIYAIFRGCKNIGWLICRTCCILMYYWWMALMEGSEVIMSIKLSWAYSLLNTTSRFVMPQTPAAFCCFPDFFTFRFREILPRFSKLFSKIRYLLLISQQNCICVHVFWLLHLSNK